MDEPPLHSNPIAPSSNGHTGEIIVQEGRHDNDNTDNAKIKILSRLIS
jgi:hypothetical protein